MGKAEMQEHDSKTPDTVTKGRRGGLEQCGNQDQVLESGFKGAAGPLPDNEGTDGSVDTRLSKWDDHD